MRIVLVWKWMCRIGLCVLIVGDFVVLFVCGVGSIWNMLVLVV